MKIRFWAVSLSLILLAITAVGAKEQIFMVYVDLEGTGNCVRSTNTTTEDFCGGLVEDCSEEPSSPPGGPVGIDCGDFNFPSGFIGTIVEYSDVGFEFLSDPEYRTCSISGPCRTVVNDSGELLCAPANPRTTYIEYGQVDPEKPCPGPPGPVSP